MCAQILSSLGQQDVGHLDVATGRGVLSLSSSINHLKNLWHPPEALTSFSRLEPSLNGITVAFISPLIEVVDFC